MLYILRALISLFFYIFNTLLWFMPIFLAGVLKLLPIKPWQALWSMFAKWCASRWVGTNSVIQRLLTPTKLVITGDKDFHYQDWYLVIANHQSWVDIMILQRALHKKIPFLNFFLKKELIFVPFLGLAWWALDFPFMKRASKSQLKKNPELRTKDMETTRKACAKFKYTPVSIVNFVEGTRFTKGKHARQNSQFNNLLKPKAGGVAFVMEAMGEQLSKLVNITISYPKATPTFFDYLAGKVEQIQVHIEVKPISSSWIGHYSSNSEFRMQFQAELNNLWIDKDKQLEQLKLKQSEEVSC
jgi:1-acyl-sn-glycerol-3-phosphate acyltransferase